jgi:carboxyl-terminal processing protease
MKIKKLAFGFLILTLLSCNYVTQMVLPATATAVPTSTSTSAPTGTPVPAPTTVALLPAYIPPECATVPLATVAPDVIAQVTPEVHANADISKREQLNILDQVSDIVRTVYVYPDFNGKEWPAIVTTYRAKVDAGLTADEFYLEMEKMIEELGDEHSFFLSPVEVKESQEELEGTNQYVGIGVLANFDTEHQRVTVISTFPDSSAEHAGIKPHDTLLTADNLPVLDDEINRILGPACSEVVLTVQSPGGQPRQVALVRHTIKGNLAVEARLVSTTDGSKIGYLLIPSFYDETIPEQIEKALNDFGTLDGLIVDVRMNGGGISTVANTVMSYFTSGNLGRFASRGESRTLRVQANPIQNSQTVPLVVIVDTDTASYGEIFAGIMRDSRAAKITGETSLGNVELLHGFDFDDGSELWLAAERFYQSNSKDNWEETGIVTDIEAFAPWDTFTFETDPSIAAALTLLGHK